MDEEESCRVLESILAYQDLELLGIALKYTRNIPTELLQVPEDERENRFMRELLNLYVKYIDIQDDTKRLWRISLCCGAEVMAERLLKKTEDYQYLPQIAEGREEVFDLLLGVPARKVLDEVKRKCCTVRWSVNTGKNVWRRWSRRDGQKAAGKEKERSSLRTNP